MRKRQARHQKIASKSRRRRHAARGGRITGNSTVWASSAGWRDNDTSMQVIGMDKGLVSKKIHEMMVMEARSALDEDEERDYVSGSGRRFGITEDAMDAIAYYGIHKFTLKDIVSARELPEAIRELSDNGYYYPEMP